LNGELSTSVSSYFNLHKNVSLINQSKLDVRLEEIIIKHVSNNGVLINKALQDNYYATLLNFLPALGFRRSEKLLEDIKLNIQSNTFYKRK